MNFLSVVLFPFTILYDAVTRFRNYLYSIGYKREFEFDTCVIAIGNLSVGGTGKTPMVEYMIRLLKKDYKITTLSRGYGRQSKGFRLAKEGDTYLTLGDEPMQFTKKFEEEGVEVAVGEERAVAIPFILAERPTTQVILLDDAYQHRSVKPNANILLTDFNKPFFKDFVLPSGRLREARKGAQRSDVLVVTKCPASLTEEEKQYFRLQIGSYCDSPVFFSTIRYLPPQPIDTVSTFFENVFLFSGIANVSSLQNYVSDNFNLLGQMHFKDHHKYSAADVDKMLKVFDEFREGEKCLLTTEKDMVKLQTAALRERLAGYPVFYLPIETHFLEDGKKFDAFITQVVKSNRINTKNVSPS